MPWGNNFFRNNNNQTNGGNNYFGGYMPPLQTNPYSPNNVRQIYPPANGNNFNTMPFPNVHGNIPNQQTVMPSQGIINQPTAPVSDIVQVPFTNTEKQEDIKNKNVFNYEDDKKILDDLSDFVQNERNSSIFYKFLSEICVKDGFKTILEKMSADCLKQSNDYNNIYKNIFGNNFKITESKIDDSVDFNRGIRWAIEEENISLEILTNITERVKDSKIKSQLNIFIYKKISRINFLHLINTK